MKDNKKTVWIISHYAGGPSYCPRIPDYLLARDLMERGYNAIVVASSFVHNTDINFISDNSKFKKKIVDGVPFIFIKTRSYTSKKDRILNMLEFYFGIMKHYRKIESPDIIISAMPTPTNCLAGLKISRRLDIPYITSIVDLWPLSIVEYAEWSNRSPIIRSLYAFEKLVYKKSDDLVFSWEGAYDYIKDMGWEKVIPRSKFHYINIGVDLDAFYKNLSKYQIEDSDLDDDTFKVMYCGSVRTANDIGTLVDCAKKLSDEGLGDKIKFIIYGDGPDREILINRCKRDNINNIVFKGAIDKKYIPFVLSKSNLNILNLKPASTQKYGNSSNKLFEYFAAGNPVVANIDEGKYPIITKYGCGKVVKAGDIDEYTDAISSFYKISDSVREEYSERTKETVKLFDTKTLNSQWEKIISARIEKGRNRR